MKYIIIYVIISSKGLQVKIDIFSMLYIYIIHINILTTYGIVNTGGMTLLARLHTDGINPPLVTDTHEYA